MDLQIHETARGKYQVHEASQAASHMYRALEKQLASTSKIGSRAQITVGTPSVEDW